MDGEALAKALSGLRFKDGYSFQSGIPYFETLSEGRALGLIQALKEKGYKIVHDDECKAPASR